MERARSPFVPSRRRLGALLAAGAATALPAMPSIACPVEADAELTALADRLDSIDEEIRLLIATHHGLDYESMPGQADLEARRWAVLDDLSSTPSTSLEGCKAKARAWRTEGVRNDAQTSDAIVDSLVSDLLTLG